MFPSFSRTYQEDKFEQFECLLTDDNMLPEQTSDVGRLISSGLKYNSFTVNSESDKDSQYTIQIKPKELTQTVENEDVRVPYVAYVYNNENTWFIESEKTDILPELRQSFYEGEDYRDRDADFKYHFDDGDSHIAVQSANPVERLNKNILFTKAELIRDMFPRKWLLETDNNEYYYLRERSGSIKLISKAGSGDLVFTAFVGGEHPGTRLEDYEILEFVTSVDYINIVDDPVETVPQEAHDRHWNE